MAEKHDDNDHVTGHGSTAVTEAKNDRQRETHPFLQFYGMLSHQQNMLADLVRTGTYKRAIADNPRDFKNKVVLDVGCGSGILSIFAAHAGAKHVYAVEASLEMAEMARKLIHANGLTHRITVVSGKVEEVELPEMVDCIVSEPIGFLLVHERMLESYLLARNRFLKPPPAITAKSGCCQMFPTLGTIRFTPFSDWQLYHELSANPSQFWRNSDFFGVNLTVFEPFGVQQALSQPVIGFINTNTFLSPTVTKHEIDFRTASIESLHRIEIPFSFPISRTALLHGMACWFDADFVGTNAFVKLDTHPQLPGTHWYQVRLVLKDPLAVNSKQVVVGKMIMTVNSKFSYDITLECELEGTRENISSVNHIALHDPYYTYLAVEPTGHQPRASPQTANVQYPWDVEEEEE